MTHIKDSIDVTVDSHQYAYKKNRSTDDVISSVVHTALTHLESRNSYVRLLFLDFSSAFNTIILSCLLRLGTLLCWYRHLRMDLALCPSPGSTSAPPPSWITLCLDCLEAAPWGAGLCHKSSSWASLNSPPEVTRSPHELLHYTHCCTPPQTTQFPSPIALMIHSLNTQLIALNTLLNALNTQLITWITQPT